MPVSPVKSSLSLLAIFISCALIVFSYHVSQGYVLAPEDDFVRNYPLFASPGTLWTPLLLSGFPVLADPQGQFFYPLVWLAKILPFSFLGLSSMTANFDLYIGSAFVLAAYFAALLARHLTGSFYGSVMAGLAYGFSGYLISELKHVQLLHTALWLPLILLLLERVLQPFLNVEETAIAKNAVSLKGFCSEPVWNLFLLSLVVTICILAGHPQTALYVLSAAIFYAMILSIDIDSGRKKLQFIALVFLAIGAGVLISAGQLLPSIELATQSARPGFLFKDFVIGQVEPMQVVGFLIPYIMGGAYGTIGNLPFAEQGAPPGLLFFGFAPVLLALYALLKAPRQRRIVFFFSLLLLSFILSLGALTPLSRIFHILPFFGNFRGLYRVLILLALSVSMLAAYGLAQLEKDYDSAGAVGFDLGSRGQKKHLYFVLYFAICCFSFPFFWGSWPLLLFVVRFEKLAFLYRHNSTIRQKILVVTTFGMLCTYALKAEWTQVAPKIQEFNPPLEATIYGDKCENGLYRIFTIKGLEADLDQLPPNLSRLWKVPSATGYEPLVSRRYSRLLNIAEGGFYQPPWHISGRSRAFDITSVKFLFAPSAQFDQRAFDQESRKNWIMRHSTAKTLIYENKRVMPRFYVVPAALILEPEAIFQTIIQGRLPGLKEFMPHEVVLLEKKPDDNSVATVPLAASTTIGEESAYSPHGASVGEIQETFLQDQKLDFKINMQQPGYFVLADLFYPGWQVFVDGHQSEILRANYVQRAVHLERGVHRLVFLYKPQSLTTGLQISSIVLLASRIIFAAAVLKRVLKRASKRHSFPDLQEPAEGS